MQDVFFKRASLQIEIAPKGFGKRAIESWPAQRSKFADRLPCPAHISKKALLVVENIAAGAFATARISICRSAYSPLPRALGRGKCVG